MIGSKYINNNDKRKELSKDFNTKLNVGKVKYLINFHDGKKTHKDGSKFYDIKTFKNKKGFIEFQNALIEQGYKGSVNAA